jgi:hypothetical protein
VITLLLDQIVLRFSIILLQIKQQWDWTKSYHNNKYTYNNEKNLAHTQV